MLAGCFGGGGRDELHPLHDAGVDRDGAQTSDAGDAATCVPRTCSQPVLACGDLDDGCGQPLTCACPAALTCGATVPNVCGVATPTCTNGWCWASPLPFGNDLDGVWAASPTDAWAVGEGGTILRSDGGAWRAIDSGTTSYISSVWGANGSDVWLAGGLYARHWNGSALATTNGPGQTGGIKGISGTSSSDVVMAGSDALWHWNGSAWTSTANSWGADDACAIAPGFALAVGFFDVYKWNGSAWSALGNPSSGNHCYGASASDVWVASDDGLHHFDGTAWATKSTWPHLGAIAGTAANDVWAKALDGFTHWDGTAWSTPQPAGAIAKMTVDLAVGPNGRIHRRSGQTWTQESGFGPSYPLSALCAFPDDTALAFGSGGMLRYRDGVVEDLGHAPISDVQGAWCASATDVWAISSYALQHYDGAAWSQAIDVGAEPVGVWGSSATDLWAVTQSSDAFHGGPAYVVHSTGGAWTIATSITIADNGFALDLTAIGGSGPHDVWAVGEMGTAAHFDGTAWTRFDFPGQQSISAISVAPDGTPFALGDGSVWTRRNNAWVLIGGSVGNLVARAANDVWGTDASANLWHYDGATWTATRTGAGQRLLAPAFGGTSAFLAGQSGGILRKH